MGSRFSDKLQAALSLGGLALFMYVVASFVNEINLWIVALIVLAIAANDFVTTFRAGGGSKLETEAPGEAEEIARRHQT